ncbi:phage tail assembly chaperone [Devosia soli]|uniref:phage tail assembly chaperone n=1 Tax=Devosia soli TaxID=361041 RepID=UPI000AE2E25A
MALCAGRGGRAQDRKFYQELTDDFCQIVRSAVLAPSYEPDIPWGQEYLWHWFIELHQGRQDGFSGPQALSWREMAEWASLTGSAPSTMEWRALRAMDTAYLAVCREVAGREQAEGGNPNTISERTMTPELFDAIF